MEDLVDGVGKASPVDHVRSERELPDEKIELSFGERDLGDVESGAELGLGDGASSQQVEVPQKLPDSDSKLFDLGLESGNQVGDVVGLAVEDEGLDFLLGYVCFE